MGVYAGSSKNYTSFNKLFDPIITEYHGHAPDAKHTSDMKTEGITSDFTEDEAKMVVSTRIRIARNLGGGLTLRIPQLCRYSYVVKIMLHVNFGMTIGILPLGK